MNIDFLKAGGHRDGEVREFWIGGRVEGEPLPRRNLFLEI
jgi:hypothetical protein